MINVPEKCFVDTNVLIYAHDVTAGTKHQRARELVQELWENGAGVLSTQILQELCFNLGRKLAKPLPDEEIRRLIVDYLSWNVVVNEPTASLHALEIKARYKIPFWDALVLYAAELAGATVVYSEDLGNSTLYGTVRVINPFA